VVNLCRYLALLGTVVQTLNTTNGTNLRYQRHIAELTGLEVFYLTHPGIHCTVRAADPAYAAHLPLPYLG
jgi:hypothetical protein